MGKISGINPKEAEARAQDVKNIASGILQLSQAGFERGTPKNLYGLTTYANALRKIAGGLVGAVGSAITPSVFATTSENPYEFGLSEFIAGNPRKRPQIDKISRESSETGLSELIPKTKFKNPPTELQSSEKTKETAKRAAEEAIKEANKVLPPDAQTTQEEVDLWLQEGEKKLESVYDDINQRYLNQEISDEQRQKEIRDAQIAEALRLYDRLVAESKALIPEYERQYETGKANLLQALTEAKTTAEKTKEEYGNIYGELLRNITEERIASGGRLRNLFSALGTAESSKFMEEMGALERAAGAQTSKTKREHAGKIADIDNEIIKLTNNTNTKIQELEAQKNKLIAEVNRNIQYSQEEKLAKIDEINKNFTSAINTLQNNYQNMTSELALKKLEIAQGLQNIAQQSKISADLANIPYQVPTTFTEEKNKRAVFIKPADMPQDLATRIETLFNKLTTASDVYINNYLKGLTTYVNRNHPAWADSVQQLFNWLMYNQTPPSFVSIA